LQPAAPRIAAPATPAQSLPKADIGVLMATSPAEDARAPVVSSRGWLGVALSANAPDEAGVVIQSVLRGSPAASAGLEVGDVVLGVDGKAVSTPGDLVRLIAQSGAGASTSFSLKRQDQHKIMRVVLAGDPGPEGRLRLGYVGEPAPDFAGVEVVQGTLEPKLAALRGQVVVLEFWASWCVACRALLPALNDIDQRYGAQGAKVIGVTMGPADKAALDASPLGLRYAVLSDPEGTVSQDYQAFALPTVFVIDRTGVVRDVFVGYDPDSIERMRNTLVRLLSASG
jgi:peroxiredoxin